MNNGTQGTSPTDARRNRDPQRFDVLIDKATEGDEAAVDELWKRFDFNYATEGGRYVN